MHKINGFKLGVAIGAVFGLSHLIWATLVAVGWAQAVLDFALRAHFIGPAPKIELFAIGTAATLVVVTSAAGFVIGVLLGAIWNWLHRSQPTGG
jgi:thiamine transporter ThiT